MAWGDDEQWREDADAALNAVCEEREKDKWRIRELETENARLKVCGSCARLVHGSRPVCRRPKYNYCPGEWMWEHVHLDDVCHFDESRWTPYWAYEQEARP